MTHILLDLKYQNRELILTDNTVGKQMIIDWCKRCQHTLIQDPIMHIFPPPSQYLQTNCNDDDYSGYTGIGILSESHISIHTYPENNSMSIDFFSCNTLDETQNRQFIQSYFVNTKLIVTLSVKFINRQINNT